MGLAAKMAAAGGTYAVVNAGADQYQQHQQGGVPPPVPGQYGAPVPVPSQPQPQDSSAFAGIISQKLHAIVATNGLQVPILGWRLPAYECPPAACDAAWCTVLHLLLKLIIAPQPP